MSDGQKIGNFLIATDFTITPSQFNRFALMTISESGKRVSVDVPSSPIAEDYRQITTVGRPPEPPRG